MPLIPPLTGIVLLCRHFLHVMWTRVALAESVEALITIPATRINFEMWFAYEVGHLCRSGSKRPTQLREAQGNFLSHEAPGWE